MGPKLVSQQRGGGPESIWRAMVARHRAGSLERNALACRRDRRWASAGERARGQLEPIPSLTSEARPQQSAARCPDSLTSIRIVIGALAGPPMPPSGRPAEAMPRLLAGGAKAARLAHFISAGGRSSSLLALVAASQVAGPNCFAPPFEASGRSSATKQIAARARVRHEQNATAKINRDLPRDLSKC